MKTFGQYIIFFICFFCFPSAFSDGFPDKYINQQLTDARKYIEVNLEKLKPGEYMRAYYVGRPIWIYYRTENDIEYLTKNDISHLADSNNDNSLSSIKASYGSSSSYVWARILLLSQPDIEKQSYRSINSNYLVIGGWSPHSGCKLSFVNIEERKYIGAAFFDPCLGLFFDVAGRILSAQASDKASSILEKYNLFIPPYSYKGDKTIKLGISDTNDLPDITISNNQKFMNMTTTEKLIHAAKYNDFETIKAAIKAGADVNYHEHGKGSPIDAAIIGSSIEVINYLINNGAKPTDNSLNVAEFTGRDEVVSILKASNK